MGQPKIEDVGHGKPIMPFGSDGTNWYAFLIDVLGHLQVDVVSAALGTGGATETTLLLIKGYVDTLETLLAGGLPVALDSGALKVKEQSPLSGVATETTLLLIKGYVDALETLLAGGLPAVLDSGALKIKEQSPLTGFATSANQATMITALQLIDDFALPTNKIFGYNDSILENPTVVGTGDYVTAYGTAVPTGEVWVVTFVNAFHNDTVARQMLPHIDRGGVIYHIDWSPVIGQWVNYPKQGQWVLKAGDKIGCRFDLLASEKLGYLLINGYKMKIAQ